MTKKISKKLNEVKSKAAVLMAKASLMATSASMVTSKTAYASGMDDLLTKNVPKWVGGAFTGMAILIAVGGFIGIAFAVKAFSDSSDEGGPQERKRGQVFLTAAIGAFFAAAMIYGGRNAIIEIIETAMNGGLY